MQTVSYLYRKSLIEAYSPPVHGKVSLVNLSHLYRFPRLTFEGRTYINDRGSQVRFQAISSRRVPDKDKKKQKTTMRKVNPIRTDCRTLRETAAARRRRFVRRTPAKAACCGLSPYSAIV